jgi:hypothetical protein
MTSWIDMHVDVLALSPGEMRKIQIALQRPSTELLAWVAKTNGEAAERFVGKVMRMSLSGLPQTWGTLPPQTSVNAGSKTSDQPSTKENNHGSNNQDGRRHA